MTENKKHCLNCGREITGRVNKLFCKDACRKYFKRHGGVGYSKVFKRKEERETEENSFQEQKIQAQKNKTIEAYAIKKLIDVGANVLEAKILNKLLDQKSPFQDSSAIPLKLQPAASLEEPANKSNPVKLIDEFADFLGNISYPFKMLVWGMPGDGKSTFCMRLANEIANYYRILYVSGEEALNSETLKDKQRRSIAPKNKNACVFINRLPANEQEWKSVMLGQQQETDPQKAYVNYIAVFYDSITKLHITPFYVDAVASDCNMGYFNKNVSHIFISHAHKDGSTYRGDGSWGHEVDVLIRCEKGIAITEKNRFGTVGKTFRVY